MRDDEQIYNWTAASMLEVTFDDPDNFLKIKETLTRIGVPSLMDTVLHQSCHILHKKGKYYIVHFKEMFAIDYKPTTITVNDIERRNLITKLLQDWNLLKVVDIKQLERTAPIAQVKVVAYKEKSNWKLVPKYSIGSNKGKSNVK